MKAQILLDERVKQDESSFAELRVLSAPTAVRGSTHLLKYSLSLVVDGVCVLRFDNEAGKGDHYHLGEQQIAYRFKNLPALLNDFWRLVETCKK